MSIIVKFGTFILNILYGIMKLLPQRKKLVIISRQSDEPSLDIKMIEKVFKDLHTDYQVVVLCKKIGPGFGGKISYVFHMLRQMYHLATSEFAVIDSYCIPVSILNHRKNLLIIQMWHSIGTMKKFAYSILDKPEGSSSKIAGLMKMHKNYDYILSAGDGYKDHLAQGFNYPVEQIVTLPLPRVEVLKDENYAAAVRRRVLKVYPNLAEKKTIVYVPTFRKANDDDFLTALTELCNSIDYERYNLVVKAHPLTNLTGFDGGRAIIDKAFSSFDMLFIADAVISDYSCIMYEAAVLKKPIYLYTYDYDAYMSSRDIYMDYKAEVPGPICYDAGTLTAAIEDGSYDYDKLQNFLDKYVYTGSQHETKDIVDFIFEHRKTR